MKIEEMEEKEQVLQARIEALQADNDFTNERLAALQGTNTPLVHHLEHLQSYHNPDFDLQLSKYNLYHNLKPSLWSTLC